MLFNQFVTLTLKEDRNFSTYEGNDLLLFLHYNLGLIYVCHFISIFGVHYNNPVQRSKHIRSYQVKFNEPFFLSVYAIQVLGKEFRCESRGRYSGAWLSDMHINAAQTC